MSVRKRVGWSNSLFNLRFIIKKTAKNVRKLNIKCAKHNKNFYLRLPNHNLLIAVSHIQLICYILKHFKMSELPTLISFSQMFHKFTPLIYIYIHLFFVCFSESCLPPITSPNHYPSCSYCAVQSLRDVCVDRFCCCHAQCCALLSNMSFSWRAILVQSFSETTFMGFNIYH